MSDSISLPQTNDPTEIQKMGLDLHKQLKEVQSAIPTIPSSKITAEQTYTPTFTGFGIPSSINFSYTIVGNRLKVMGSFVSGVATGVQAKITLPSGLLSDTAFTQAAVNLCGKYSRGTFAGTYFGGACLIESGGLDYIKIGAQLNTQSELTQANGSQIASNGEFCAVIFEIPLAGHN